MDICCTPCANFQDGKAGLGRPAWGFGEGWGRWNGACMGREGQGQAVGNLGVGPALPTASNALPWPGLPFLAASMSVAPSSPIGAIAALSSYPGLCYIQPQPCARYGAGKLVSLFQWELGLGCKKTRQPSLVPSLISWGYYTCSWIGVNNEESVLFCHCC